MLCFTSYKEMSEWKTGLIMAAMYQFFENPPSDKTEEKGEEAVLHARLVNCKTVDSKELCERISVRSTFQEGEVAGIMSLFRSELLSALKNGDKVELEGVGTFAATLKCPPVHHPKEIRAESIHFSRVVFTASKELRRDMSLMKVERAADKWKKGEYTPEQRRKRILSYLQNHTGIQSSDCMGLNGCTRYMAQADLKYLSDKGLIDCFGGRKVAVYVLSAKKE